MFWIGLAAGAILSPILIIGTFWLLRDVTPPILFMPSDWDQIHERNVRRSINGQGWNRM